MMIDVRDLMVLCTAAVTLRRHAHEYHIASLPFYGLEIFVGFIQAAVFMMLAVVFMGMATQGHGSGAEHH